MLRFERIVYTNFFRTDNKKEEKIADEKNRSGKNTEEVFPALRRQGRREALF
jgi:hypothetical protein